MRRLLVAVLIGGAALSVAAGDQAPGAHAGRRLAIDAVAYDRSGRPVDDLRREDFEVWIAGYRVPIDTLAVVTPASTALTGRSVVLLLDDTLPLTLVPRVREIARHFVARLAPGDEMAVVTLNGERAESSADASRLTAGIDRYSARAMPFVRPDLLSRHVLETIASISEGMRAAEGTAGRRNTLVAIGSAWLFDTPIPPPNYGQDVRKEWIDAMRAMAFANVSLYVIDPGGVGAQPTIGASGFARDTGGHTFTGNDFSGAADRVMREAGSHYVIEVSDPPVQRKADLRELDVRVLRRGVSVRARRVVPGVQ